MNATKNEKWAKIYRNKNEKCPKFISMSFQAQKWTTFVIGCHLYYKEGWEI